MKITKYFGRSAALVGLVTALTSASQASVQAQKGGIDSGGAGLSDPRATAAWFLHQRPVRYCIIRDPHYSVAEDIAQDAIERAWGAWATKIEKSGRQRPSPKVAANLPAKIETNIETRMRSVGSCRDGVDLTFYLGGNPRAVPKNVRQSEFYLAFSEPKRRDDYTWSMGYIFIKNLEGLKDSDDDLSFGALVLHELGHVFGMSHIPGTIMDEDIIFHLGDPDDASEPADDIWSRSFRQHIDHEYTLLVNDHSPQVVKVDGEVTSTLNFTKVSGDQVPLAYRVQLTMDSPTDHEAYDFVPDPNYNSRADSMLSLPVSFLSFATNGKKGDDQVISFDLLPFERLRSQGTISRAEQIFPAVYSKNFDGFTHRLSIFVAGKWQDLYAQKAPTATGS